jgi:O-methyltransferase domain/Dimerisation domain
MSAPSLSLTTDGDVHQQMFSRVFTYWACQTLFAVAGLSIADHLADGSLTAAEVAEREGSAPETTLRLMRAAVAAGLLTEEAGGRFASTPLLGTLRADDPRSMRPFVLSMLGDWLPWNNFTAGLRTGETPSAGMEGGGVFEYLEAHPDEAELFTAAMASGTAVWGPAIAAAIDTNGVKVAVDIGGANGSLLRLLQRENPSLQGIIFDRPNIMPLAEAAIKEDDLTDRTRAVPGSFFESVPSADLMLLKFILHDWSDEECITILKHCRESLAPGGRIAVIDTVVGADNPHAALMDMNMFVACTGRERSLDEFDSLFSGAGLQRKAVHETGTPQSVIEVGLPEA